MASSYKIGTTQENMVTLDTLVDRDPQSVPVQYSEYIDKGDGTAAGVGWLETEWRWFLIDTSDITALRTYCTGISSSVYIQTPDIDGAFEEYSGTMIWPQSPEFKMGSYYEDFVIQFRKLTELAGTGTGTGT